MVNLISFQDNGKLDKMPKFDKLTYSDSGKYEVVVTMGALIKKASFELVVEGKDFVTVTQIWLFCCYWAHSTLFLKNRFLYLFLMIEIFIQRSRFPSLT